MGSGTPIRSALTREEILVALRALSDKLGEQGVLGEVCLFGGAVMVLAFNARLATKDVDAVFQPTDAVRAAARQIGTAQGLPPDWLNDGVKGFTSSRAEFTAGGLPQFPHLRLTMPVPEYLLAMKCMAARIGTGMGEADDTADIVFLIRHLALETPEQVLDIVGLYYPPRQTPVKTRFLVETLFEERRI